MAKLPKKTTMKEVIHRTQRYLVTAYEEGIFTQKEFVDIMQALRKMRLKLGLVKLK